MKTTKTIIFSSLAMVTIFLAGCSTEKDKNFNPIDETMSEAIQEPIPSDNNNANKDSAEIFEPEENINNNPKKYVDNIQILPDDEVKLPGTFLENRRISFLECETIGGKAERVYGSDNFIFDICSTCADCHNCVGKYHSKEMKVAGCPECISCVSCLEENNSNKCPNGTKRKGTISDASIEFQCCSPEKDIVLTSNQKHSICQDYNNGLRNGSCMKDAPSYCKTVYYPPACKNCQDGRGCGYEQ